MPETDSMDKHVERKLLLARLMQRAFRRCPGSKFEMIWASEISDYSPLLRNSETFLVAIERMREELAPGFKIDTTNFFSFGVSDLIGVNIDDPKRLDRYILEKEVELAEVKRETNRQAFVLDSEGNLYLADSDLPAYSIERGSLRHKLIYYLAKHGRYMSAAQLAEKIGTTPKRVRTTVGQLRDKVDERFNVPGMDLIQSRDTGSYCASSVQLKVPKGYTP